jgi:hypothetical protein
MNKFVSLALFIVVLMVNGKTALAQASADECLIYAGGGGERVFPVWTDARKVIVIPYGEKASVWLPAVCKSGTGASIDVEFSKSLLTILKVSDEVTSDLAKGVRIYFEALQQGTGRKEVEVTVTTTTRKFVLTLILAPTYEEALKSLTSEFGQQISGLRTGYNQVKSQSAAALKVAHDARARTEAGVEIDLGGFINPLKSSDFSKVGGGLMFNLSGTLWKVTKKNWLHLGLSGKFSWQTYQAPVLGLATFTPDVFVQEFDLLLNFMLKWQFVNWAAFIVETGLGVRFFSHADAVTYQGRDYYIRGVEGRSQGIPLWDLEVGFKFYPVKALSLGVRFLLTQTIKEQVIKPSGDPDIDPDTKSKTNIGVLFTLGWAL